MSVDDRYLGDIWVRHFATRNHKPLSAALIRRIVELIHDRVTQECPLHDVLAAYQIPETQFMQAVAEDERYQ
jgi:hypothetical protein